MSGHQAAAITRACGAYHLRRHSAALYDGWFA